MPPLKKEMKGCAFQIVRLTKLHKREASNEPMRFSLTGCPSSVVTHTVCAHTLLRQMFTNAHKIYKTVEWKPAYSCEKLNEMVIQNCGIFLYSHISFFIITVSRKWLILVAMNIQMSVLVARSALTYGNTVGNSEVSLISLVLKVCIYLNVGHITFSMYL